MINYQNDLVTIRALEPDDLELLFDTENDTKLWKYSNRFHPYSKSFLNSYIANADKDVFETRQIKFTITNKQKDPIGFIDLFDFEPLHRRAAVGLTISASSRGRGYANASLKLIQIYAKKCYSYINFMHTLLGKINKVLNFLNPKNFF